MKKKVLAAMLVAAMTATMFAGCGSKDNGASNDGTQAANNGMKIAKFNSTIHLYSGILFCTSGV